MKRNNIIPCSSLQIDRKEWGDPNEPCVTMHGYISVWAIFCASCCPLTSLVPTIIGSGCPSIMNNSASAPLLTPSLFPYRYMVSVLEAKQQSRQIHLATQSQTFENYEKSNRARFLFGPTKSHPPWLYLRENAFSST